MTKLEHEPATPCPKCGGKRISSEFSGEREHFRILTCETCDAPDIAENRRAKQDPEC